MVSAHSLSASFDPCDASVPPVPSDPSASSGPSARSTQPSARAQAEKLHETLLLAQATSNLGRRKFISALLALCESKLHLLLGSPSIDHYARTHFGIERAVTYEYLRVARSLRDLPRCDEDFRIGKLTWSALREITRVATTDSEEEWIAFARKYSGARLRGEVKEAVLKNRERPRKDGYSLPGLRTRLVFELEPEEQDLASRALEEVAREMSERLEGAEVEPKDAFLFMARRFLEERVLEDAGAGDPVDPEKSLYTILYHRCPDCRRAGLPTADGLVEIDSVVVDRVEGDARKIVIENSEEETPGGDGVPEGEAPRKADEEEPPGRIDRPNPPSLVRKIRLRDGRACANPGCDRKRGLHAHHIVERARGGATAVQNEVLLCSTCHSLNVQCVVMWSHSSQSPARAHPRRQLTPHNIPASGQAISRLSTAGVPPTATSATRGVPCSPSRTAARFAATFPPPSLTPLPSS